MILMVSFQATTSILPPQGTEIPIFINGIRILKFFPIKNRLLQKVLHRRF